MQSEAFKQHSCFNVLSPHLRGSTLTNTSWTGWAAVVLGERSFPVKALCLVLDMAWQAGQAELMLDSAAAPVCCL